MNKAQLTRPFPPELVKHRPGRNGKSLSYVETHAVIARLNEGCDTWSFEIVSHEVQEGEVIVVGKLTADGIVKMAFGGSEITVDRNSRVLSLADDLKSAASDCLKKAASLLGVGLELYGAPPTQTPASPPSRGEQAGRWDSSRDPGLSGHPNNLGQAPEAGARPRSEPPPAGVTVLSDRLTSRQMAAVYTACRKNMVPREQLEALVRDRFGKNKLEHLTKREASQLIDDLGGLAGPRLSAHG